MRKFVPASRTPFFAARERKQKKRKEKGKKISRARRTIYPEFRIETARTYRIRKKRFKFAANHNWRDKSFIVYVGLRQVYVLARKPSPSSLRYLSVIWLSETPEDLKEDRYWDLAHQSRVNHSDRWAQSLSLPSLSSSFNSSYSARQRRRQMEGEICLSSIYIPTRDTRQDSLIYLIFNSSHTVKS